MKIGFYSQNYNTLGKYWEKLKNKADCWWGVPEKGLYNFLKRKKAKNISYHLENYMKSFESKVGNKFVSTDPNTAQKKIVEEINPDVWIVDTPNKLNYYSEKAFRVQTFHALPIKKAVFYEPFLNYDLILLPGQFHKDEFIKRFNLKKNDERFKIVGWPNIDDLIKEKHDRKKIIKKLNLDPQKKTIMYAPTWGWGHGNDAFFARWFDKEEEVFEKICKKSFDKNLNLIVRLHSLSFSTNKKKLIDIAKKYKVLWQTNLTSNYRDDPNKYLWITDILISDLSGIISEYMVLNRPIIYIDPDESIDPWQNSDMPKNFRAGHVVREADQLLEAIDDSIMYPQRFSKQRKDILNKVYYNLDGNATSRGVEAIMNFAENKGIK